MAKKVVLEVEGYTKVLGYVSGRKLRSPGAIEAFKILNEATLMDITVLTVDPPEEVPPVPKKLTAEDFDAVLKEE